MNTILLSPTTGDLLLDANGNIAMAQEPFAIAQDVASAVKLFAGELYFDTSQGMPYFDQILGHNPPLSFLTAQMEAAALTVPNVVSAKAAITNFQNRQITGSVEVIDTTGQINNVVFP